ncbi:MAG: hypothetical protein ABII12_02480 [Planctomycetota bacterium]
MRLSKLSKIGWIKVTVALAMATMFFATNTGCDYSSYGPYGAYSLWPLWM